MLTLIMGGSGSGKSAYAEAYIEALSGKCQKYYIATMRVFDKEGQAKVQRHQSMRADKGFLTIEQPVEIERAFEKGSSGTLETRTALLECMSNLVANEMFSGKEPETCEGITKKIVRGIESLRKKCKHLVIVTNNVFEDGVVYEEATVDYIRAMGSVNEKLAGMANEVIEVVVGIPVMMKEGK